MFGHARPAVRRRAITRWVVGAISRQRATLRESAAPALAASSLKRKRGCDASENSARVRARSDGRRSTVSKRRPLATLSRHDARYCRRRCCCCCCWSYKMTSTDGEEAANWDVLNAATRKRPWPPPRCRLHTALHSNVNDRSYPPTPYPLFSLSFLRLEIVVNFTAF